MSRWAFTLNSYSAKEYDYICNEMPCSFLVVGKEKGTTPHLQGYVEFSKLVSFKTMRKYMPRAHLEKARSTRARNVAYCSKSGNAYVKEVRL